MQIKKKNRNISYSLPSPTSPFGHLFASSRSTSRSFVFPIFLLFLFFASSVSLLVCLSGWLLGQTASFEICRSSLRRLVCPFIDAKAYASGYFLTSSMTAQVHQRILWGVHVYFRRYDPAKLRVFFLCMSRILVKDYDLWWCAVICKQYYKNLFLTRNQTDHVRHLIWPEWKREK